MQVTAFTASDFGRTLTSNGDGSDHGWGSHHFLVGGAVRGGRFHGALPSVSVNGPDDVGQGRLLPHQRWTSWPPRWQAGWASAPADLPLVAPNIGHYSVQDLGLLNT
jgi:hypothetical protein